jgi:hypothetical protein
LANDARQTPGSVGSGEATKKQSTAAAAAVVAAPTNERIKKKIR